MADEIFDPATAINTIIDLERRLEEAESTLQAIQSGQVDALVVSLPDGNQIYTLRGAETSYRILVEAMNEGALVLSHDGTVLYSNVAFADMLEIPLEQVVGSQIQRFMAQSDRHLLPEMLAVSADSQWKKEVTLIRVSNGSGVSALLSISAMPEYEQEAIAVVVTDITATRRTEAQLEQYRLHLEDLIMERTTQLYAAKSDAQQRAAQLESLISSMSDGVLLHDVSGREIHANNAARKILGGDGTGTLAQRVRVHQLSTLDGDPVEPQNSALSRALRGEAVYNERYWILDSSGHRKVISVSSSPVRGDDHNVAAVTSVVRDITDQVEFERKKEELHEREHRIVELLQQSVQPAEVPTELDGFEIAVNYRPASKEADIGGDFYDVFDIDCDKFAFVVGDVAGKGLKAALRVSAARHSIRSYAYIDSRPSKVITLANEAMCRGMVSETQMLTLFYAVVDRTSGYISYANAGHVPPLVCDATGTCTELDGTGGLPIGILPGFVYAESSSRMDPDGLMVVVTDGITEARSFGPNLFGMEGFAEVVKSSRDRPAQDIGDELLSAATEHAGGQLQDDVAVLVLRRDSKL